MQKGENNISGNRPGRRFRGLRKNRLFALFFSAYLFLFPFVRIFSQVDSLEKYIELAAANNPSVQKKITEYEAYQKKSVQAGALPDPQLDAGLFFSPMELVGGRQYADLRLMQMFPWFGVLRNSVDEMRLLSLAKYEEYIDSELQLVYDVKRVWYELFRLRRETAISEKNLEILRQIEQLSLVRYKSPSAGTEDGTGGLTDLYRIRIEEADLRNRIASLGNREKSTLALFNSYLDRPPESDVHTGEVLPRDTLVLLMPRFSEPGSNNIPVLNMISLETESYGARKKMAIGMAYPMIGLGLSYSVIGKSDMAGSSMNGRDMIMPMVSVTLPVYRKKYAAMREEAELMGRAGSQNYRAVSNSLTAEWYAAVQLYQDARQRMDIYDEQYTLASKTLEIMLKSFSASSVSLTDVLRVIQQTLDYELLQLEAVTDLNTAGAWLMRLMAVRKNQ